MATTPQQSIVVHTPSSPLHGARYDNYHPYTTRKSTRQITRTQRAIETPPPNPDRFERPESSRQRRLSSDSPTPRAFSPPSSTQTSPRKRISSGKVKDISSMDEDQSLPRSTSNGLLENGLTGNGQYKGPPATAMLPTPAKTPRKKQVPTAAANAAARILFPAQPEAGIESLPTPRKNRKNRRHVGFSLYGSMEEEVPSENPIQIYTDSRDKVPELDHSEDNPFLELPGQSPTVPDPSKGRNTRKRKASQSVGEEESKAISEAFDREEGMIYVFRGKKIYRKFSSDSPPTSPNDPNTNIRPLTRSTIKPRLLFPTPSQRAQRASSTTSALEAEEASTDIEDHILDQHHSRKTPDNKKKVTTPVTQSFPPPSPPTTAHAHAHITRSATKKARLSFPLADPTSSSQDPEMEFPDRDDVGARGSKKISPFSGWARRKAGLGMDGAGDVEGVGGVGGLEGKAREKGKGKKREGEEMGRGMGGGGKRVRGLGVGGGGGGGA